MAKIGPGPKAELLRPRVIETAAGDVGRQQVGRELDAVKRAGHAAGHGLAHQCLAHAGHVFQEDVFAGQQRDHAQSHGFTLAQHHAADVSLELGNQIFGFGAHGGSIVVDRTGRRERERAETCPHWVRMRGCRFFFGIILSIRHALDAVSVRARSGVFAMQRHQRLVLSPVRRLDCGDVLRSHHALVADGFMWPLGQRVTVLPQPNIAQKT